MNRTYIITGGNSGLGFQCAKNMDDNGRIIFVSSASGRQAGSSAGTTLYSPQDSP